MVSKLQEARTDTLPFCEFFVLILTPPISRLSGRVVLLHGRHHAVGHDVETSWRAVVGGCPHRTGPRSSNRRI